MSNRKRESGISKVKELEKKNSKLEEFCAEQLEVIASLKKQLIEKTDEINHLKTLLEKSMPVIGQAEPLILSDEEEISLMQLDKLKKIAMTRQLTLDEIKIFDLLVKNKRLAQKKPTIIGNYKNLPDTISKQEL